MSYQVKQDKDRKAETACSHFHVESKSANLIAVQRIPKGGLEGVGERDWSVSTKVTVTGQKDTPEHSGVTVVMILQYSSLKITGKFRYLR